MTEVRKNKKNLFERFANWATIATGSSGAFIGAFGVIIIWGITGPLFHYSDTWQLVINTGTTIVTFLMVFLIQKSQNKDSKAIHLKLNELLASHQGASNRMVDIEDITEKELDQLHKFYVELAELAEEEDDITCTHSIDAARENHTTKLNNFKTKPHYINARNNHSKKATEQADLDKANAIRYEVFVIEQNCPPHLEVEYNDESVHFLATVDGEPAGACRWRKTENGYKLERFAVLKNFRGYGLGQEMVKAVLADLPADAGHVYLNSQTHAVSFYKKLGFETSGPEFEEAGIKHYKMVKK